MMRIINNNDDNDEKQLEEIEKNNYLENKIIDYLDRLEKKQISSEISLKRKKQLLEYKLEYERIKKEKKETQENLELLLKSGDFKEENGIDEKTFEILKKEIESALKILNEKKEELINEIKEKIIEDEESKKNFIVEIRPGAGGIEAGLFVRDLYRMYAKLSEKQQWKLELVENEVDQNGNFNFVSFLIKNKKAFNLLKNEAGVHRVQRIPKTENKGRIHTSTASVVILPEPSDIVVNINDRDLDIRKYGASSAGGQHVNKTQSAVTITHIPTGVISSCQDSRDQSANIERAKIVLKARILEKLKKEKQQELGNLRSTAIGTAERSEKIRTYNWKQNRITDHRLETNWEDLISIMDGGKYLLEIMKKLIDWEIMQKIDKEKNKTNN